MKKPVIAGLAAVVLALAWMTPAHALENITPTEAYYLATTDPDVYILDVRTPEEWKWVGHPGKNSLGAGALLEGKVFQVSWKIANKGKMIDNPSFLADVDELFGRDPQVILILMCRSGVRGVWANDVLGPAGAGYTVLNMIPGFEGRTDCKKYTEESLDLPCTGYRNVEGWKVEGLPYSFSGPGYGD